MTRRAAAKRVPAERAAVIVASWRDRGERVVLACGVFDLLEAAHARGLAAARALGARLVVAVLGDAAAAGLEGAGRPVLPAHDRAALLAALRTVDLVVELDAPDAAALIARLRPDVLAMGDDDRPGAAAERQAIAAAGGMATRAGGAERGATTERIARVRARHVRP